MNRSCITRICEFARSYRLERVRTPQQLYDETGYAAEYSAISQADIEASVSHDMSLVEDWLASTLDKRWTPAWALTKHSEKVWVVSYVPKGGGRGYEIMFASPIPACALMIRMEMEVFRLRER
jgi:hypothetical protein